MNAAAAGKRAEGKVREDLEANGYVLLASHLSRGPADLMAAKFGQSLAIQVKRGYRSGGGIGPDPWNELYTFAAHFGSLPVIAIAAPRLPIAYKLITAPKDRSGRRQPWQAFSLDALDAA